MITFKYPTPLLKTDLFKKTHSLKNVYIKDESKNPTGTIKDRRNRRIIDEAQRLGVDKLTLITSGNNGYSLSLLAKETPIKVVCIVEKTIDQKLFKKLSEVAHQVIPINLSEKILRTEEIIAFARERDDEVIWDVTNGYEDAYYDVVAEIFKKLPNVDYIVVPIGSGGIFIGFVEAIRNLKRQTKVIGIGPEVTHNSFADKLSTPWSPYARAMENYKDQGHTIFRLSESDIRRTYQRYQHAVSLEPSSSIIFSAPDQFSFKPEDKIVFVNSGKTEL